MIKRITLLFAIVVAAFSCESPADISLTPAIPTLVVDGFINNLPQDQRIVLNFSQSFLDNTPYLPAEGAVVSVSNTTTGTRFSFSESDDPGVYIWSTSAGQPTIGDIGDEFGLRIEFEGNVFVSTATLNRTTPVDEIVFFEQDEPFSDNKFFQARFMARDRPGFGDSYWFKTFWNGNFLNRPAEINIGFDSGASANNPIDGQEFIFPIRISINPTGEDESYQLNDRVRVEIHSISNEAFDYFTKLQIQTDRPGGFAELFAQPLANLPTNISEASDPEFRVLGYFSVSAVESLEVIFTEDLIRE